MSVSADAVNEVKNDLTSIRQQLHQLFATEDQMLAELADLAVNHFPELVMQFPEFHLNNAIVSLFDVMVVYISMVGQAACEGFRLEELCLYMAVAVELDSI